MKLIRKVVERLICYDVRRVEPHADLHFYALHRASTECRKASAVAARQPTALHSGHGHLRGPEGHGAHPVEMARPWSILCPGLSNNPAIADVVRGMAERDTEFAARMG